MHPLLILSAGVVVWAASRQIPQARALVAAVRAAASEFQEQKRKAAALKQAGQTLESSPSKPK